MPVVDPIVLQALTDCLLDYGRRELNPVLEVLPDSEPYRVNTKYPEQRLRFGQDHWRAYYHSHDVPDSGQSGEHGHFHIFYRIDNQGMTERDWTHIVALGMDELGQPVRWFTVNNWVTGDTWIHAEPLKQRISIIQQGDQTVSRWLAAMIGFYRTRILGLLEDRDRVLQRLRESQPLEEALQNRDIYNLSGEPIDLMHDLEFALGQNR